MSKMMDSWFFMRPGFASFHIQPDKNRQLLFGPRDRAQREHILDEIEGASYSGEGHKGVVFGDFGRGKTHLCHNLCFEIQRKQMDIIPVYVKCGELTSKESFSSLFKELVLRLPTDLVRDVATEYAHLVHDGKASSLIEVVQSEELGLVMSRGLTAVDHDVVRNCMRWLGGEPKIPMGLISQALKPQLTDSREFGAVMRGIAHMLVSARQKVPVYFIDEAERFESVTNVDTFASWSAALRELTEIVNVGLLFFVGAKTRNNLPTIVVLDEIVRRIGAVNYIEFLNPGRDELRDFVVELLATLIRKGPVPEPLRDAVDEKALDPTVPEELIALTKGDPERLRTYPFEPDAFKEFVEQTAVGDLSGKPSEVLKRLQKAARRAMTSDVHVIDSKIVDAVASEGF